MAAVWENGVQETAISLMIQGEMSVRTAASEMHHQQVHAEVDSSIAKVD